MLSERIPTNVQYVPLLDWSIGESSEIEGLIELEFVTHKLVLGLNADVFIDTISLEKRLQYIKVHHTKKIMPKLHTSGCSPKPSPMAVRWRERGKNITNKSSAEVVNMPNPTEISSISGWSTNLPEN